jgi:hypothetical protein
MTKQLHARIGMTSLLLTLSFSIAAHHGQTGLFDESRTVQMTGSVKEWIFINPHPVLVLEVTADDGETADWDLYFGPQAVSALRRRGFSADTFTIGESIIVNGHLATTPGARGIDVWRGDTGVMRADGTAIP